MIQKIYIRIMERGFEMWKTGTLEWIKLVFSESYYVSRN